MNTTEYMELVRALAKNITPEYRSIILTRLTQINNKLLDMSQLRCAETFVSKSEAQQHIPNDNNHRRSQQTHYEKSYHSPPKDLMRPNIVSSKRKESVMLSHPATSHQDLPFMGLTQRSLADGLIPLPFDMPSNTGLSREKYDDYQRKMQNREYIDQGLELDDIIDDLVTRQDNSLDAKLRRLNELASKQNSEDNFDSKLQRLTSLHNKIVSDNRVRK